ncbi:hypothetical protein [Clostridium beijerinckii]|uniref:hypothetical protein n=1 Tax=Clostridium beijerinckii TaxID=1520 RepID=UPI00098C10DB|nr:hypothetical protein [Clostridium beijerinckii]NRT78107.1 hypothetical protein [Clostridium beijerinckii]OOM44812.1 hypothetical protein CBEIJ_35580 [Clostridium beijerinckii]
MSTTTRNYNLVKPTDIETADITVINNNMDIIDNTMKSQSNKISALNSDRIYYGGTSTGSGNAYTITIDPNVTSYSEPLAISFKANYSSTGNTTINVNNLGAKAIKKANGNNVTNLIAGSIYTMRYNGTNFILQGEGGSGNATASDILAGKTASTDAGDVVGNILSKSAQTYNPSTTAQIITSGQYLSGNQTIAPVTGNATINDVVSGKVFSSANGINLTGQATIESLGGYKFSVGTYVINISGKDTSFISSEISVSLGYQPLYYVGWFVPNNPSGAMAQMRIVLPNLNAYMGGEVSAPSVPNDSWNTRASGDYGDFLDATTTGFTIKTTVSNGTVYYFAIY